MPTKSAGSSQKDWRPPCTKTSDPDAYRRVGEIVETIILNGEIPGKRTFREVDPELWDRFKESSIKNTLLTWKKKIYATHREEGINKDQNKGKVDNKDAKAQDTTEDDDESIEDYVEDEEYDAAEDYQQEEETDDNNKDYYQEQEEEIETDHQIPPSTPPKKSPSTPKTSNPSSKMPQQRRDAGRVKSCEVVNIPGNPNRVFMRIIEDEFLNRFLKIQICANAGPMGDVVDNFKLEVHPDGHGCDIELPISPSFYLVENATLLGYGFEKNGDTSGPLEHVNALKHRFDDEDDLYKMVEKFTVSFGRLEVCQRLIQPEVRTIDVHCPTFIVYLEIKEEKVGRKQKITLDSGSKNKAAGYTNAYSNHAFASPTGTPAPHNYSSPSPAQQHPRTTHHQHDHSPAAPAYSMNHGFGSTAHNHYFHQHQNMPPGSSYPHGTPNHVNHPPPPPGPSSSQPGHHHHPPPSSAPQMNPFVPPISAMDPALIAMYLQHLNLAATTAAASSAQQQPPSNIASTRTAAVPAPVAVSTASSVASEVKTGHDGRSTGKFKRGDEHRDVTSARVETVQRLREMGGRGKLTVETSEENFLTPAAYVQNTGTSVEAGGNAFFPAAADDGLDV